MDIKIEFLKNMIFYNIIIITFHILYSHKKTNKFIIIYSIICWNLALIYMILIFFNLLFNYTGQYLSKINIDNFNKLSSNFYKIYLLMSNQLLRIPILYLNDGNFIWYKKLYSIILWFLFIFFYIILYIIASINDTLGNIIYSILTIENVFIFYFGLAEGLTNIPLRFLKNMDLN